MFKMLTRLSLGTLLAGTVLCASASERDIRNSIALGALAFTDNCRKCHQLDGYGEEPLYPSLHDAALLADKALLIKTILHGRMGHDESAGDDTVRLMPSLDFLTDREIAGIVAFITNSWGDDVLIVSEEEVANSR